MVELASQDFVNKFAHIMYWLVVAGIFGILIFLVTRGIRNAIQWYKSRKYKPSAKIKPTTVYETEGSRLVYPPSAFIGLSPEQIKAYFNGILEVKRGNTDATTEGKISKAKANETKR